jgi:histidinol-phosphate phosphatase family protein
MSIAHQLSSVAILAGGFGTRLKSRTGDRPKPMIMLAGKPLLQHQIELCRDSGFTEIALLVQHRSEVIRDYFSDGRSLGVKLTYVLEPEPRGTAGALRDALPMLADRFLVLYGDTYLDVNLRQLWRSHIETKADATLFLHPNDHPQDSDLVEVDTEGCVISVLAYPHPQGREARNLVNAALYVLEARGLNNVIPAAGKSDLAKHTFPRLLAEGRRLMGYISPEYIKDIGTPERIDKAERDIAFGLPEKLSERQTRSAVFLDRDGTLIDEVDHLHAPDQLRICQGGSDAIRRLNRDGRLAVVVTNQPVLARGKITVTELGKIHARLDWQLGAGGAYLDRIYYCPHHPDRGFKGEVVELKIDCDCRKPSTGLIDRACQELGIDRSASWIIGDTTSDMEAGRRSGLKTILVETGYAGCDEKYAVKPHYICNTLASAIDWILTGYVETKRRLAPWIPLILESKRYVFIDGSDHVQMVREAQVLKESLGEFGLVAHTIILNNWTYQARFRGGAQGQAPTIGVEKILAELEEITDSVTRQILFEPILLFKNEQTAAHYRHSIGPHDILILVGIEMLKEDFLKGSNKLTIKCS